MCAGKKTYAVIRAVYDNQNAPDEFERELDFVLSRKVSMVIIEPEALGEITWRWIRTGNWLHKTAVVCGFSALTAAGASALIISFQSSPLIVMPVTYGWLGSSHAEAALFSLVPHVLRFSATVLSAISAASAGFYALFWQWDPCCKYQVASSLASLPRGLTSVVTSNNSSTHSSMGRNSELNTPLDPYSNGASPKSSAGYSQAVTQNGCTRSRPVVVENHRHSKGPPLRPVVLVHRDDGRRKLLHNSLALSSVLVAGYIIFRWINSDLN